ncbi:kinase-like protein [Microthyrium microscopicum]|uniref:Kinase-like protein n=1 Tax=Microthyrium microscopicum TaxID=703497 RepID=A0A6A6UBJ0_9PEZI|nr:kinase-like protein [Microthyrium microscopicum]
MARRITSVSQLALLPTQKIPSTSQWLPVHEPNDKEDTDYYPVKLEETFKNGKYKVIRKLSQGRDSTWWLASDKTRKSKYVAIKILTVTASKTIAEELSVLEHLSHKVVRGVHGRNVLLLVTHFIQKGLSGDHQCLVFDPITESVEEVEGRFPDPQSPILAYEQLPQVRFPLSISKAVLGETLRGLRHIHRKQVVHGDLHSGKIFLVPNGLETFKEDAIRAHEEKYIIKARTGEGEQDILVENSLHEFVNFDRPLHAKVGGFGCAYQYDKPRYSETVRPDIRAPEVILGEHFDDPTLECSRDIWSFGCLMYEVLTGDRLFFIEFEEYRPTPENMDDAFLIAMHRTIGPLPNNILNRWSRTHLYFNSEGVLIDSETGEDEMADIDWERAGNGYDPDALAQDSLRHAVSLEHRFRKNAPSELKEPALSDIVTLLQRILVYDPSLRPTVQQLQEHYLLSEAPSKYDPCCKF